MEKAKKQALVAELYQHMEIAMYNSSYSNLYAGLQGKDRGLGLTHFKIVEFYVFLGKNPNLTDEEIREILNSNNKFSFLRKLDNLIPNLFEELKVHGVSYVKNAYIVAMKGTKELSVPRI